MKLLNGETTNKDFRIKYFNEDDDGENKIEAYK